MAARTSTIKSKHAAGGKAGGSKGGSKSGGVAGSRVSKSKGKAGAAAKKPVAKQVKTKSLTNGSANKGKPKKKEYTEAELNIPKLNMVTPVGVEKPRGKKKGKVFVDDKESMMTILSLVHADKEGQIESKMQRARQLEEIREARKVEAEKRAETKRGKFEEVKDSVRRKRSDRKQSSGAEAAALEETSKDEKKGKKRKSVSFA